MTSLTIPGPYHRHVDHESGQLFHVNPITGEIIARNDIVLPKTRNAEFQAWAAQRRADANLTTDHTTAQSSLSMAAQLSKLSSQSPSKVVADPRPFSRTQRLTLCRSLRFPIRCLG